MIYEVTMSPTMDDFADRDHMGRCSKMPTLGLCEPQRHKARWHGTVLVKKRLILPKFFSVVQLLCIPVSPAASERVFSSAGRMLGNKEQTYRPGGPIFKKS